MRAIVFRLLLVVLSAAVTLGLAEGVLRLVPSLDPHLGGHERLFAFDSALGWRFVPGAEETIAFPGEYRQTIRINAAGHRDVAWARSGERRIAVLGDSFTSNLGVDADSVFTRHLERRLGPDVVVRNYGVNGYNQVQQLIQLESEILDWNPQRVIVVHYPRNDLDENASRYWTARYERPRATLEVDSLRLDQALDPIEPTPAPRWREGLRLRTLARTLWYRMNPDATPVHRRPPELRWSREDWGVDERAAFDLTIALFERMKSMCDAAGVEFGVVLAPSVWQVRDDAWAKIATEPMVRTQPQATLTTILNAWGIDTLDLLPALRTHGGRLYYPSEQHWTEGAQPVVAEAVADWIEEASAP